MPTMSALDGVNRCAKSAGRVVKSDATDCAPVGDAQRRHRTKAKSVRWMRVMR
jgi:hypothetical protein